METLMLDKATLALIDAAARTLPTPEMAGLLVSMVDLTSLEDNDTPEKIAALCSDALTPIGSGGGRLRLSALRRPGQDGAGRYGACGSPR